MHISKISIFFSKTKRRGLSRRRRPHYCHPQMWVDCCHDFFWHQCSFLSLIMHLIMLIVVVFNHGNPKSTQKQRHPCVQKSQSSQSLLVTQDETTDSKAGSNPPCRPLQENRNEAVHPLGQQSPSHCGKWWDHLRRLQTWSHLQEGPSSHLPFFQALWHEPENDRRRIGEKKCS